MAHPVVDQHEGGHGLDDRHGARHDAGVVAAAAHELRFGAALLVDGALVLNEGGGRLEGDAEDEFLAVADAALDAAGTVGLGADFAVLVDKDVVVLGAELLRAAEAAADLEALGGGDGEHGLGEVGFEAIEHGHAEADWQVAHAAFDDAADRVAVVAHGILMRSIIFSAVAGMGAAHRACLDLFESGEAGRRRAFRCRARG